MKRLFFSVGVLSAWVAAGSARADLVVTEIMADPVGVLDRRGEWFEVQNTGTEELDLTEFYFTGNSTQRFAVTGEHVLAPGEFYVFGSNPDFHENGGVEVDYGYHYRNFSLANDGDDITVSRGGQIVDVARYGEAPAGRTLFLPNMALDNGDEGNWQVARIESYGQGISNYGTPGAVNEDLLLLEVVESPEEFIPGTSFVFELLIDNPTDRPVGFDAWVRVSGQGIGGIVKSVQDRSIGAMQAVRQFVSLEVPADTEPGPYRVDVELGDFEGFDPHWREGFDVTGMIEYEDQFNHDEELEIPDNDPAGIDSQVHVQGVPGIPVELTVLGDFLHDAPEELHVVLASPTGESWDLTSGSTFFSEVLDYAGDPNGHWTLNVADLAAGNEGSLYGWAIEVRNAP